MRIKGRRGEGGEGGLSVRFGIANKSRSSRLHRGRENTNVSQL